MDKKEKKSPQDKIAPNLQFAVLCDGIVGPDQRGKVSFVGVFDKMLRPSVVPNFALALGWSNGKGQFKIQVKLLDPDLKQIFNTPEIDLVLHHEAVAGRTFLNIAGMHFKQPGVYWIEILLEAETVLSIPMPVDEAK